MSVIVAQWSVLLYDTVYALEPKKLTAFICVCSSAQSSVGVYEPGDNTARFSTVKSFSLGRNADTKRSKK